jgi:hypothetical protein
MDVIAVLQETGWPLAIEITQRMRAYLMILFGRATGSKGKGRSIKGSAGDVKTGDMIITRIPARPIWQRTFDANIDNALQVFMVSFERVLLYRLGQGVTVL